MTRRITENYGDGLLIFASQNGAEGTPNTVSRRWRLCLSPSADEPTGLDA